MSYIALYRKYRPDTFDKILGQENITQILKNQVKTGKISHAYIFSGSRGTGKTTAAKVFARAINCLNPEDGEPCNKCSVCKSILNGSVTDVIEMDAASNNSVDDIRQIKQEVAYATVDVKYRVYIIDEAHMLSTSAFNALLKTIEEPPANVVFILATTEPNKIPATILSRCLRFEFNRLSLDNIVKELTYVLNDQKIPFEKEALEYIAKAADGGMRDSLSILERCISEQEQNLTLENVQKVIGTIDLNDINTLVQAIINYDSITALNVIDRVVKSGKSLRDLVSKLTESFLNLLVESTKVNPKTSLQNSRLAYIIDRLSLLDNKLKNSTQPEIQLKSDIVSLCCITSNIQESKEQAIQEDVKQSFDNLKFEQKYIGLIDKLSSKLKTLEEKVESLNNELENNYQKSTERKADLNNTDNAESEQKEDNKSENFKENDSSHLNQNSKDKTSKKGDAIDFSKYSEFKENEKLANSILVKGLITIYAALFKAKFYQDDTYFIVSTPIPYSYNKLSEAESITEIKNVLKEKFNIDKNLKIILVEDSNPKNDTQNDDLEKVLKSNDIKVIDTDKK